MILPTLGVALIFSVVLLALNSGWSEPSAETTTTTAAPTTTTTAAPTTTTTAASTTTVSPVADALCTSAHLLATGDVPNVDKAAELVLTADGGFDAAGCTDAERLELASSFFGAGRCDAAVAVDPDTFAGVCPDEQVQVPGGDPTAPANQGSAGEDELRGLCEDAVALATGESKDPKRSAALVAADEFRADECGTKLGELAEALFLAGECDAAVALDAARYEASCRPGRVDKVRDATLPWAIFLLAGLVVAFIAERLGQFRVLAGRLGLWDWRGATQSPRHTTRAVAAVVAVVAVYLVTTQLWPDAAPRAWTGPLSLVTTYGFWTVFAWPKLAIGLVLGIVAMSVFRLGLEPAIVVAADDEHQGKAIVERVRAIAGGEPGGVDLVRGREDDIKLDSAVVSLAGPGALATAATALSGLRRNTDYTVTGKIDGTNPTKLKVHVAVYRGRRQVGNETITAASLGVAESRLSGDDAGKKTFVEQLLVTVAATWAVYQIENDFYRQTRVFGSDKWPSAIRTAAAIEWHSYLAGDGGTAVERQLYSEAIRDDPNNYVAHFNLGYLAVGRPSEGWADAKQHLQQADEILCGVQLPAGAGLVQPGIDTSADRLRMMLRVRFNLVAAAINELQRLRVTDPTPQAASELTMALDRTWPDILATAIAVADVPWAEQELEPVDEYFGAIAAFLARILHIARPERDNRRSAFADYIDACRLAWDPATSTRALSKLEDVIEISPGWRSWTRVDPCFFQLRSRSGSAREFDKLTLTSGGGVADIHCSSDALVKAITAFGLQDRAALRAVSFVDLSSLAIQHDVSLALLIKARQVAKLEGQAWPGTSGNKITIHDANLIHRAGYRTLGMLEAAISDDAGAVRASLRKANASKHAWDGVYASWAAIEGILE